MKRRYGKYVLAACLVSILSGGWAKAEDQDKMKRIKVPQTNIVIKIPEDWTVDETPEEGALITIYSFDMVGFKSFIRITKRPLKEKDPKTWVKNYRLRQGEKIKGITYIKEEDVTINGEPFVKLEFRGNHDDKELHWLQVFHFDEDAVWVFSGVTLERTANNYMGTFDKIFGTIVFRNPNAAPEVASENTASPPPSNTTPKQAAPAGDLKTAYELIKLPPSSGEKQLVAVMDLKGAGGESLSQIAASLTDLLRTELINIGYFKLCDRTHMATVMKEVAFQQGGACDSEACMVKLGKTLGVGKIITGSVSKLGKMYIVSLQMIDIQTGEIVKSISERAECKDEDLIYLIGIAAKKLCM